MRVFITGATGFIGSAIVRELIGAGYDVMGLARSDAGAESLATAGVHVHRGDLKDPESLRSGAAMSDGVIHTAFIHDFSQFAANAEIDRHAIETMGSALDGTGKPFVITSGVGGLVPGHAVTEDDSGDPNSPVAPRLRSEVTALSLASQGVRVSVVRLPASVHGDSDHGARAGFVSRLIGIARQKGVSAYVGDGQNRWPAVHRLDAARLFRMALEKGSAGSRYHGVAEEGVPLRDIAAVIGRHLNVPIVSKSPGEAAAHFGFLGYFAGMDIPASSAQTRERLGWHPEHATLIPDLDRPGYFET